MNLQDRLKQGLEIVQTGNAKNYNHWMKKHSQEHKEIENRFYAQFVYHTWGDNEKEIVCVKLTPGGLNFIRES
jgi:hypothetical protein